MWNRGRKEEGREQWLMYSIYEMASGLQTDCHE